MFPRRIQVNISLSPAGESPNLRVDITPPFADNSRRLTVSKSCAISQNYNEFNLLKNKFPIFQQSYTQRLWKIQDNMVYRRIR